MGQLHQSKVGFHRTVLRCSGIKEKHIYFLHYTLIPPANPHQGLTRSSDKARYVQVYIFRGKVLHRGKLSDIIPVSRTSVCCISCPSVVHSMSGRMLFHVRLLHSMSICCTSRSCTKGCRVGCTGSQGRKDFKNTGNLCWIC